VDQVCDATERRPRAAAPARRGALRAGRPRWWAGRC